MNYEETLSTLKAIQASYAPVPFLANSETGPRFVIDSDTREIIIPEEFKFLAVKMDHMSEKIYFEIPRYFDDEDLATKICVIQYINTNGDAPIEAIVAAVDVDTESEYGKIIFRWDVDNYLTRYAGMVSFAVRFYTISDDNRFTYSWNTLPATLPVLDTLDNTNDTVSQNYPTELVQWQFRMSELDRTITDKINSATASIDADVKAAQDARQGAEDVEARVNAIVAGNEAYTKQQSHDLFALALRGTAEAAKSITIYPDNESNVIVTAHGFTRQEGSGDPEPPTMVDGVASGGNIRAIKIGGRVLVKAVLTGAERMADVADLGDVTRANFPDLVRGPAGRFEEIYSNKLPRLDDWQGNKEHCYVSTYPYIFISNEKLSSKNAAGIQEHLKKMYDAGDPYILWYIPADEADATGLYAPLKGAGKGHTGYCVKITRRICEGSTVITRTLSGCDKKLILDGSLAWGFSTSNSIKTNSCAVYLDASQRKKYSIPENAFGYSESLPWYNDYFSTDVPAIYSEVPTDGVFAVRIAKAELVPYGYDGTASTGLNACKAYLNDNPVPVWYRTIDYTAKKDKPVSLEVHTQTEYTAYGTESITDVRNMGNVTRGNIYIPKYLRAPGTYQTSAKCSHFPQKNDWLTTVSGFYVNTFPYVFVPNELLETTDSNGIQKYLKQQYEIKTPVQFEYPLASPVSFAHDPVDFIASPDEEGTWVITGEANGAVSAEYNKNITKALEDILTRVSALELHALGG